MTVLLNRYNRSGFDCSRSRFSLSCEWKSVTLYLWNPSYSISGYLTKWTVTLNDKLRDDFVLRFARLFCHLVRETPVAIWEIIIESWYNFECELKNCWKCSNWKIGQSHWYVIESTFDWFVNQFLTASKISF